MPSLLKKIYYSQYTPFLLLLLYPLIVFPLTIYQSNQLNNKLNQQGIKLEAKVEDIGPTRDKHVMELNCKVTYKGIDTFLVAKIGGIRNPWKAVGKSYAALYLEDENFLALMLNKEDSLKFNIVE